MRIAIAFCALLFLLAILHSEFLVSNSTVGGKIFVLCENQTSVFVSQPDGSSVKLSLDENHQASFSPQMAGPHTVQCGKETKVASVAMGEGAQKETRTEGALATMSLAILLFGFFIATFLAAKFLIFDHSRFQKTVENGKVKITVRLGKKMENVVVSDPVCIGFSGKEMRLSIGTIEAGKTWEFEYEIDGWDESRALPASLTSEENGKKVSMLSELFIGGKSKKLAGNKAKAQAKEKRRLPKAN